MTDQTVTINDNLHKVDNVLTALNFLLEEVQTRKDQLTSTENLSSAVKEKMGEYDFMDSVCRHFNRNYGDGLCREVAFTVMEKIDADIEKFIEDRVNKALEKAGVSVQ
jgi:hypothetical protein